MLCPCCNKNLANTYIGFQIIDCANPECTAYKPAVKDIKGVSLLSKARTLIEKFDTFMENAKTPDPKLEIGQVYRDARTPDAEPMITIYDLIYSNYGKCTAVRYFTSAMPSKYSYQVSYEDFMKYINEDFICLYKMTEYDRLKAEKKRIQEEQAKKDEERDKTLDEDKAIGNYIKSLPWYSATDMEKTLVAGNIRSFASWYKKYLKEHDEIL